MQANVKALSPAATAAIYAYLAGGGIIRRFPRGASAIDPSTGKAYICPLPIATYTESPDA